MENLGRSDFHLQDPIWWNKKVCLKQKSSSSTPFGMRKGFVTFQTFFLAIIWLKLLREDLVIEYDIPIRDRRKYNYLANGIYLDWFKSPKIFMIMFLIKLLLLLWVKRRSQNIFIPFLKTVPMLMLKINGLIAWMSWTNWKGMVFTEPTSIVPLKLSYVLFISNFFIGLFAQTNSFTK